MRRGAMLASDPAQAQWDESAEGQYRRKWTRNVVSTEVSSKECGAPIIRGWISDGPDRVSCMLFMLDPDAIQTNRLRIV